MDKTIKNKRKGPCKWTFDLEKKLISLWRDRLESFRSARKNAHIYSEINRDLGVASISGGEVHVKIQNMTKKYRKEKQRIGPSGGEPSSWLHYREINQMLGELPANRIELADESFLRTTPSYSSDDQHTHYYSEIIDDSSEYAAEETNDELSISLNTMPSRSSTVVAAATATSPISIHCTSPASAASTSAPPTPATDTSSSTSPPPSTSCSGASAKKKKLESDRFFQHVAAESETSKAQNENLLQIMGGLASTLAEIQKEQKKFNNEMLQIFGKMNRSND